MRHMSNLKRASMCKRSLALSLFMGGLFLVPTHLLRGADAPATPVDASQAKAREEVLRLEREWATAEDKHDEATLRRILDEKFVVTFGSKKPPYDKEGFIKAQLAGDVDPTESQTLSDQTVIVDGDTAVVVATDTERGTKKGEAYTAVARYTVTYIRRNGRWVALAEHMVLVPQAK
jgi:ketosteroid isomerase-like protein